MESPHWRYSGTVRTQSCAIGCRKWGGWTRCSTVVLSSLTILWFPKQIPQELFLFQNCWDHMFCKVHCLLWKHFVVRSKDLIIFLILSILVFNIFLWNAWRIFSLFFLFSVRIVSSFADTQPSMVARGTLPSMWLVDSITTCLHSSCVKAINKTSNFQQFALMKIFRLQPFKEKSFPVCN